jgi:SH3-like domain-containing protein
MRVSALALVIAVILPVVGWAQPTPPPAPPAHPPAKKPPPVVRPHGPTHAQKPPTRPTATPKPPEPPLAPAVVPPAATPTAAKPADPSKLPVVAPKLPRFESLRTNEVNLRSGPGTRYKIDWVYKRADLPIQIEREFEHWRAIRDADGIQGWVNQATLTARRNFVVQGADATLLDDPDDKAAPVAILKPGVIGRIKACQKDAEWCQVQVAGHSGYLRRTQFWGTLAGEQIPSP